MFSVWGIGKTGRKKTDKKLQGRRPRGKGGGEALIIRKGSYANL